MPMKETEHIEKNADVPEQGDAGREVTIHDVEWYRERIEYLAGFMTPERAQTMQRVAEGRTRRMTILMENTFYAQNASALVRHCDAFGVQDIHTVETLCRFSPNVDIVRGSDKWVTFHRHDSTTDALAALRGSGYRIVATTPHRGDITPEEFDVTAGPFALVFGTELEGISEEVIAGADEFLRIPMCGFVESLNVSAAAAILIYMLSQRLRMSGDDWRLADAERAAILFEWMTRTVRDSARILRRGGY